MDWTVLSIHQIFFKRQYVLNRIAFWWKFSWKTIWIEPYCLLVKICLKDKMGWTVLSYGQNFSQKTIWVEPYFFWWKLSQTTIWVEPYCLLVKIFLKDYMGWTILSFGENFPKRQYGLNRIVFLSKFFSKDNMG